MSASQGKSEARAQVKEAAQAGVRILLLSLLVGVVTGCATWLFLTVDHLGVKYLWEVLPEQSEGLPSWLPSLGVAVLMTGLATLIVVLGKRRPFDTGAAEAEYDRDGRMDYHNIFAGALFSLASLFSGAAVGPEAPLVDINGGIGTFIADRMKVPAGVIKVMTYAGVAGAFSAFFGAAPIGALLAIELINPKALSIDRTSLTAGLASGAAAWVTYVILGGEKLGQLFVFPDVGPLTMVDLGYAVVLGIVGGILGLVYGTGFVKLRLAFRPLRDKPLLAGLAGGAVTAVMAVAAPILLFSGQSEVPTLIENAASFGVLLLVGLGVGKLLFSTWSLSTGYFGGPIFPVMFAGTCFGLAVHLVFPGVSAGVAVMGLMTGMIVSATVAPLSVTFFLALIADPTLVSAISIAAVAAFVIRQAIAPTVPGIYRQTQAAESGAQG